MVIYIYQNLKVIKVANKWPTFNPVIINHSLKNKYITINRNYLELFDIYLYRLYCMDLVALKHILYSSKYHHRTFHNQNSLLLYHLNHKIHGYTKMF